MACCAQAARAAQALYRARLSLTHTHLRRLSLGSLPLTHDSHVRSSHTSQCKRHPIYLINSQAYHATRLYAHLGTATHLQVTVYPRPFGLGAGHYAAAILYQKKARDMYQILQARLSVVTQEVVGPKNLEIGI